MTGKRFFGVLLMVSMLFMLVPMTGVNAETDNHVLKITADAAKEIALPASGKVTISYWEKLGVAEGKPINVRLSTPAEGLMFDSVCDGENVYYSGEPDGSGKITANEWHKVKLELDLDELKLTAAIDDHTPVHANLDRKATLTAFIILPNTGEAYLDDFTVEAEGFAPVVSDYETGAVDFGGASIEMDNTVPKPQETGNKALRITGDSTRYFSAAGESSGTVTISYWQKLEAGGTGGPIGIHVTGSNGGVFQSTYSPAAFFTGKELAGVTGNKMPDVQEGQWQKVRYVLNLDEDTFEVYYDGALQLKRGMDGTDVTTGAIQFQANASRPMLIDDFAVTVSGADNPLAEEGYDDGFIGSWTDANVIGIVTAADKPEMDPDVPTPPPVEENNHVLKMTSNASWQFSGGTSSGKITIGYKQKMKVPTGGLVNTRVISPEGLAFDSEFKADGSGGFTGNNGNLFELTYTLEQWAVIRLELDLTAGTYGLWIDEAEQFTGGKLTKNTNLMAWQFFIAGGAEVEIDDIAVVVGEGSNPITCDFESGNPIFGNIGSAEPAVVVDNTVPEGPVIPVPVPEPGFYEDYDLTDSLTEWTDNDNVTKEIKVDEDSGASNKYAKFTAKSSASNAVTKNFDPTTGKVTISFDFKAAFAAGAGKDNFIRLIPYSFLEPDGVGGLFELYLFADGRVLLGGETTVSLAEWNTLRIEVDFTDSGNPAYKLFMNGKQFGFGTAGAKFVKVGNLNFLLDSGSTLYLDNVTVKNEDNTVADDRFSDAANLDDWENEANVTKTLGSAEGTVNKYLSIAGTGNGNVYKTFMTHPVDTAARLSMKLRIDSIAGNVTVQAMNSAVDKAVDLVFASSGELFAAGHDGPLSYQFTPGQWVTIENIYNFVTHQYSIKINGSVVASELPFDGDMNDLGAVNFAGIANGTALSLDNFGADRPAEGGLYVRSLKFLDSSGAQLSRLSGVTGVKFTADISNDSFGTEHVSILLAYYVDGVMQTVAVTEADVPMGGETVASELMAVDTAGVAENKLNVQAFVMDNLTRVKPLSRKFAVKGDGEVWVAPMPWYNAGDNGNDQMILRPDFNEQFGTRANWDSVYAQTNVVKTYINILNDSYWGTDLRKLVSAVGEKEMAFEVGGVQMGGFADNREGAGRQAAEFEWNDLLKRWVDAGGTVDYITTDHAITHTLDTRDSNGNPAFDFSDEVYRQIIDQQMEYFAYIKEKSPDTKFGMIESLGYFDVTAPDGTTYTQTAPDIRPAGDDKEFSHFMEMVMDSARSHGVDIEHFDIDYSYLGVARDAMAHSDADNDGMNFGRIMEVERVCRGYGIKVGVIFNEIKDTPEEVHDNIVKYYEGYRNVVGTPDKAVFQSWWKYPLTTGPEEKEGTFFHWVRELLELKNA